MSCSKSVAVSHDHKLRDLLPDLRAYLKLLSQKKLEAKLELEELESNVAEPVVAPRYPKRNVAPKNYKEDEVSDDDDYLFCDDCEKEYKGECPVHGPLSFIPNHVLPNDGSVANRAKQTLPDFLSLSASGIKGAGLGVWTERDLPKGLVFGPYEGTVIHNAKQAQKSGFCWQIKKQGHADHYIDADDISRSNWMRFVNCANNEFRQNLVAFQYKRQIYYRTYKPIAGFCELLVWYGDQYAHDLNIDLNDDPAATRTVQAHICDRCNSAFTSAEFLAAHRKRHRDQSGAFKHKCHFCAYSSNYASHLEQHLRTHTGERPFRCPHCDKAFPQKRHLMDHLHTHTGDLPYRCDLCGRSFSFLQNLQMHSRSHRQEKPHQCLTCDMAFVHRSALVHHERTHAGQKPHHCSQCKYKCSQLSNLRIHVICSHTRDFPHHCSLCGKGFPYPSHLRQHQTKKCRTRTEE